MDHSFPAFRSRNYRLYFWGQSISSIGTWMTRLATSWLVYRLTDSAFLLGLTAFLGQIPALFLSPLAGVWVDRWDRHRAMVIFSSAGHVAIARDGGLDAVKRDQHSVDPAALLDAEGR